MEDSTAAQQMGFKNVGAATSSSNSSFSATPSGYSGAPVTTDQGTQDLKPPEASIQGKGGKDRPNETCKAKTSTQARKCKFLRWLLEPAKRAASRLHWRSGKQAKLSDSSVQQRFVCD